MSLEWLEDEGSSEGSSGKMRRFLNKGITFSRNPTEMVPQSHTGKPWSGKRHVCNSLYHRNLG